MQVQRNDIYTMSIQRHDDVASTFMRRCINAMIPLGNDYIIFYDLDYISVVHFVRSIFN